MNPLRSRIGTSSLLGLPSACQAISRSAGCHSRRLRTFVENPVHSHLLGASPLSASSLSPSCPCTPTFEDQSPAVGQCFHPSTWRIGVDGLVPSHLYGPTVVKVLHDQRSHPSCSSSQTLFANVGFEQTGRTDSCGA